MLRKLFRTAFVVLVFVLGMGVLFLLFRPFLIKYLNAEYPVGGDYLLHFSNLKYFYDNPVFPLKAWQGTWFAGYPVVEGYPWFQYYLIVPIVNFVGDMASAMEYYAIVSFFLYFAASFALFWYVSKNPIVGVLSTFILVYGADAGMSLFVGGFVVFIAAQLFLPLILLFVCLARDRGSRRFLVLGALALSLAFYAHASMTGIIIIPAILPFLFFDKKGKLSLKFAKRSLIFFLAFAGTSLVVIYQFIDQALRGLDLVSKNPTPIAQIPSRLSFMFSWQNPALLPIAILTFLAVFFRRQDVWEKVKSYFFSFLFVFVVFMIMVLNIGSFNVILLAERAIWAVSLTLLSLFSVTFGNISKGKRYKFVLSAVCLVLLAVYSYFIFVLRSDALLPKTLKEKFAHAGSGTIHGAEALIPKYNNGFTYPTLTWNETFDNYRTDGLSYEIYHWWNLVSPTQRYKGWFPALKGLPLHWSGLVSGGQYGILGPAGTQCETQPCVNQALFFLDWYAIRRLEMRTGDNQFADYLKSEAISEDTEQTGDLTYLNLKKEIVGPIYSATNASTVAVVAPESQYDNFIRMLSYGGAKSSEIIPIYLGGNMVNLKKKDFSDYDAIFLYGYKWDWMNPGIWEDLKRYVENGGKLFVETGQKAKQSSAFGLPYVFPVSETREQVVTEPYIADVQSGELTEGLAKENFAPLNYNYLPFSMSVASMGSLRGWAQPLINKGDEVLFAWGKLGEGKVVWSGMNLPFHMVDNRNYDEAKLFANIVSWFFDKGIEGCQFEVVRDKPEHILLKVESPAKGVLIKEHFNSGWVAKVDGVKVGIKKAGLLEMYVPLEEGSHEVEVIYRGNPVHWVLFGVSMLVLFFAFAYAVSGGEIKKVLLGKRRFAR